jgi:isoprenylcysteine carboxyl methyltransferase (ICMT) family protein YpbQ
MQTILKMLCATTLASTPIVVHIHEPNNQKPSYKLASHPNLFVVFLCLCKFSIACHGFMCVCVFFLVFWAWNFCRYINEQHFESPKVIWKHTQKYYISNMK